ncbi:M48 family metalloprotease [bacterium]|nr:M48 family metalloprotease [bacterium]
MKRILLALLMLGMVTTSVMAADYNAAKKVPSIGKKLLEKNGLPTDTKFEVIENVADNSNATTSNIIYISSTDLKYAGNDNETAAVVSNEIGHIINGKTAKNKLRDLAKNAITNSLNSDNIITTAANSQYLENKTSLNDNKEADITGVDLMIQAGYNPLAMVVLVTKMPGSTLETLKGIPSNSERAMNVYDYLVYTYPSKVKSGYNCQEYRNFLAYADPIVKERNSNGKKLAKFNKEQEKNKTKRAKNVAKYKTTGTSGWDTSYQLIKAFTEQGE